MSLDISLIKEECVFDANITHNLNRMAHEAQLYYVLWRPEEIGVETAADAIPFLKAGIMLLVDKKDYMIKFVPENGWGSYHGLVTLTQNYLDACYKNIDARIRVSR